MAGPERPRWVKRMASSKDVALQLARPGVEVPESGAKRWSEKVRGTRAGRVRYRRADDVHVVLNNTLIIWNIYLKFSYWRCLAHILDRGSAPFIRTILETCHLGAL